MHFSEDIWEKVSRLWHSGKMEVGLEKEEEEEMKDFLKGWFAVRRSMLSARKSEVDTDKAWQLIDARTFSSGRKLSFSWMRYVAVLILVAGISMLLINRYQEQDSIPLANHFPSGSHKAELMLSSGKRIVLDDSWTKDSCTIMGTKFTNDLQKGELSYRISADPCRKNEEMENEYHSLNIPKGGDYSIILPDGTKVWLNSESTFRFPSKFRQGKREVWLDGEACFKVARDETSPFKVHLPEGAIKVLGTTFNVSAYSTDPDWHTVLVNGKVHVSSVNGNITLKPADMYSVNRKTGLGRLQKVDTELYTSWIDGKFHFNAYSFEEIVRKLERWYDFEMIYEDEDIKTMHFTGSINKHRPMDDVLHFLEKTTDIHFKIDGKRITVSKTR